MIAMAPKERLRTYFATLCTSILLVSTVPVRADMQNFCEDPANLVTGALTLLKNYDSEGTKIFQSLDDKSHFTKFLKCEVAQYALDTAVHESTHTLDHSNNWPYIYRYVLLGDKQIELPKKNLPDFKIVPGTFDYDFDRADQFVQIYNTRGQSLAGSTIFGILDEMNAASHGNMTAVNLWEHSPKPTNFSIPNYQNDHRDELLFFMTYLKVYLHKLRAYDTKSLARLSEKSYSSIIKILWKQAEFVLSRACLIQNFGSNDRAWATRLYSMDEMDELTFILGSKPVVPIQCRNLGW